jgi:hypothetical protein
LSTLSVRTDQADADDPAWSRRTFTSDDIIVSELLPGFHGKVASVWVDREWEEAKPSGEAS